MPLPPARLPELSRWLDAALDLPAPQRADWLAVWLAAQSGLDDAMREALRQALAEEPAHEPSLPALPAEPDGSLLASGQRVGAYRLLRELGRGGMGCVWLAERADGVFERQVAIKFPRWPREGVAQRLVGERRIGARLNHPHIARLYDAGVDAQQQPYIVMELVVGQDLMQHATARGLGRAARMQLWQQVAAAVAHAHQHLVVHRDLKPGNVMVTAEGQAKLLDFGIARELDELDAQGQPCQSSPATQTHSPHYAAPEQLRGGPLSTATDQYALAVIAHQLLLEALPPAPGEVGAGLAPAPAAVLRRALRIEPSARYPGVDAFAADLGRAEAFQAPLGAALPWPERLRLLLRRRRLGLAIGLSVALLLAALGGRLAQEQQRSLAHREAWEGSREYLLDTLHELTRGTPAQALADAEVRARRELGAQPLLLASILTELGVLQRNAGQPERGLALMQDAHALHRQHSAPQQAIRQVATALLAQELASDPAQHTQVRSLLDELQGRACEGGNALCARSATYAALARASLAFADGDNAAALAHTQTAVQSAERAFGVQHRETTWLRLQLALVARDALRFDDAAAQLAAAQAAVRTDPLRAQDAERLPLVQALLALDRGRYPEALQHLAALSAGEGVRDRLRAQAWFALGQLDATLAHADASLALAPAGSHERTAAQLLRASSLAAMDRPAEAQTALRAASEALAAETWPDRDGRVRTAWRLVEAELALRHRSPAEAEALLRALALPPQPLQAALQQALLAHALRAQGRWDEARAAHRAEARLAAAHRPPGHLLRLRAEAEAAFTERLATGDMAPWQAAASAYAAALPPDSTWRQRLQQPVSPSSTVPF